MSRAFFIPNAFTPNGDGNNDYFNISGSNVRQIYIDVFNRWGEKVYSSQNINAGWDGSFKGQPLPIQALVYKVKVVYNDGKMNDYKGSLTILR